MFPSTLHPQIPGSPKMPSRLPACLPAPEVPGPEASQGPRTAQIPRIPEDSIMSLYIIYLQSNYKVITKSLWGTSVRGDRGRMGPHTPAHPRTPPHGRVRGRVGQIVGNLGDRGTLDPALPRTLEPEQILGSVGSKQDFEAGKSMSFLGLSRTPSYTPSHPRTQSSGSLGSCPSPTPDPRANPGIFWLQMMSSGGQILGLQSPAKWCHFESFSPTLPPLPFLRIPGSDPRARLAGSRGNLGDPWDFGPSASPTHFVPFSEHLGWVYLGEITVKHSNVKQSR